MQKHSRQRDTILRVLRETDCHPTAAWIHAQASRSLPRLSLGTVYRNLDRLREEGAILRLSVGDGTERFDGNPQPHLHFFCRVCHKMTDAALPAGFDPAAQGERDLGFRVTGHQLVLYGVCRDCRSNGKEQNEKRRSLQ